MLSRLFIPPYQEGRNRAHQCNYSRTVRLCNGCPAILISDEYDGAGSESMVNLEIALDPGGGKTCKSRHGCSSLERNNDKELGGEE